jgi:predicted membrane channel-forming protein YqfA (hemolysin III family)
MARDQNPARPARAASAESDDSSFSSRAMWVAERLLGADDGELLISGRPLANQLLPPRPLRSLVRRALSRPRPGSGRSDDDTLSPSKRADVGPLAPLRRKEGEGDEHKQQQATKTAPGPPPAADDLAAHAANANANADPSPYRTGLAFHDAPDYVRFPCLLTGYRSGGTYARNLLALFQWHTETLNAWTMIAGVALSVWQLRRALVEAPLAPFLVVAAGGGGGLGGAAAAAGAAAGGGVWSALPQQQQQLPRLQLLHLRPPDRGWREALPFWALTLSCAAHAPFSVGFHLFRGMGPRTYNLWRRLDQAFIFLASVPMAWALAAWARGGPFGGQGAGSSSGDYNGLLLLLGSPAAVATAAVASVVAVWAVAVVAALKPGFRRDKRQMVLFVGTIVACYWAPMAAQAWHDVASASAAFSASSSVRFYHGLGAARAALGVLLSLMAGAATYATGWPERRWPGRFDLVGSSHQLMHVGVVCAHAYKHAFLRELWRRRCVEEAVAAALAGGVGIGGGVFAVPSAAELGPLLAPGAALASALAPAAALASRLAAALAAALEQRLRTSPSLALVAGGGGGGVTPAAFAALAMALAVLLPRAGVLRASAVVTSAGPASPATSSIGSGSGSEEEEEEGGGGSGQRLRRRRWRVAAA